MDTCYVIRGASEVLLLKYHAGGGVPRIEGMATYSDGQVRLVKGRRRMDGLPALCLPSSCA